jgi:hypothetical protein
LAIGSVFPARITFISTRGPDKSNAGAPSARTLRATKNVVVAVTVSTITNAPLTARRLPRFFLSRHIILAIFINIKLPQ